MCGSTSIRDKCRDVAIALCVMAVAASVVPALRAQEPPRPGGTQERAVRNMNSAGNISDAATYQDCYRYYAYQIAAVGQETDGKTRTLEEAEARGLRRIEGGLRDAKPGSTALSTLQGYVLDWMAQIARGSYSDIDEVTPQGRAMAMMLIAGLDGPDKPLPAALPVLIEALDGEDYNNDAVRAAALYGVWRHAEAGVDDAEAKEIFEKAAKLATELQPPPGRDEEIHTFFRARAVDTLAELGATDKVPSVSELAKVLSMALDAANSRGVELRCAAAAAVARQNWAGKTDVDFKDMGHKLANLAIAVTNSASSADELKSRLYCVDQALTGGKDAKDRGIAVAAEGESKEYLDGLVEKFLTLYDAAFSPQVPGSEVQLAKVESGKLTDWLIKNPIAEAPEADKAPADKPAAKSAAQPKAAAPPADTAPAEPAADAPAAGDAGADAPADAGAPEAEKAP